MEEDRQVGMRAFNSAAKTLQARSLEILEDIEALGSAPRNDGFPGSEIKKDLELCVQFEPPDPNDIYIFHEFLLKG